MKNKKVILLFYSILILFFSVVTVLAHGSEGGGIKTDDIVKEILQKQKASDIKELNCDKISDQDLERLGESIMSYMHPDEREHNAMDNMMGGEGSESLKQAHIMMAKRFLGCESIPGFMGMMGSRMMDFSNRNGGDINNYTNRMGKMRAWNNMGGVNMGVIGLFKFFGFLTWFLLIIFLFLGSIYFYKQIKRKK